LPRRGASSAAAQSAWFLVRCVEPPDPPLPLYHELLLSRGPFTLAGELALIRCHAIDLIVTRDSGGAPTEAKLEAARLSGLPVLVVRRPPRLDVTAVTDVASAFEWVRFMVNAG
jgi:precorrin-6A/cobalt-precorrin-6A reductase